MGGSLLSLSPNVFTVLGSDELEVRLMMEIFYAASETNPKENHAFAMVGTETTSQVLGACFFLT